MSEDTYHVQSPSPARAEQSISELRRELASTLLADQNADGGWSAARGAPSNTEATALAALALRSASDEAAAEAIPRAVAWLRRRQKADGSWPATDQVPMSSWMTSLAAICLMHFREEHPAAVRGGRWLLDEEASGIPWMARLLERLFPERRAVDLDPDLKSWPWSHGTSGWVEPTAHALLALKLLRDELPARRTRYRIEQGELMLFDRMCEQGGWNYGNSRVMGIALWPYPDTTALALIALQDVESRPEIGMSLDALEGLLSENDSALSLALAILCFRLYGRDISALRERLPASIRRMGTGGQTRPLALALLALDDPVHPFRVPADD